MVAVPIPPTQPAPTTLRNLTPAVLRLRCEGGRPVSLPSDGVMRPAERRAPVESVRLSSGHAIEQCEVDYEVDIVLPDPQPGTLLIVPRTIALMSDRDDLRVAIEAGSGISILAVIR